VSPPRPLSIPLPSPNGDGQGEGFNRRLPPACVSVERALRVCCHREDAERSAGDDAIPCDSAGLLRPLPGTRNDRHARRACPTLSGRRGLPPPAHSLHAERETAFEGGLIVAAKDRECRSGGETSCLDRITYRKLMR